VAGALHAAQRLPQVTPLVKVANRDLGARPAQVLDAMVVLAHEHADATSLAQELGGGGRAGPAGAGRDEDPRLDGHVRSRWMTW